mgnify:FL=1
MTHFLRSAALAASAVLLLRPAAAAQTGHVDPLFGPATAVTQGLGMTEEIERALRPGPEHELLSRLVGEWAVAGIEGRDSTAVAESARFERAFDGAWILGEIEDSGGLRRLVHLGFDAYRGSFAMWEIGRGFTSPQVRVGAYGEENATLRFTRTYTIRVRERDETLSEVVDIRFVDADRVEWTSTETVGTNPSRLLRHVVLTRDR